MQNPSTGELFAAPPRARDRLEDAAAAAAAAAEHGSFHSITSADQASGRSLARHSKFLLGFVREVSQDVFRIELPEFSDKNIHVSHASPCASHASAPFFFAGSF
jgi:hypothetical protein